jgi:putative addiction module component (TIGR02574 family)
VTVRTQTYDFDLVAKNVLSDALALPVDQRMALAERLWKSVRDDPESFKLTPEQERLIDQRLAGEQAHPSHEFEADHLPLMDI